MVGVHPFSIVFHETPGPRMKDVWNKTSGEVVELQRSTSSGRKELVIFWGEVGTKGKSRASQLVWCKKRKIIAVWGFEVTTTAGTRTGW